MTKETIINTVCEVCGIAPEDLNRRTRAEPIPTARALAAHFLCRELRMGSREILQLIGNPAYKRTAIYHYIGRKTLVENRMPFHKDLRLKVEQIEERLGI